MKLKKPICVLAATAILTLSLAGCGNQQAMSIEEEAPALAAFDAAVPTSYKPVASGVKVFKNKYAIIDYSNIKDGYVMVRYTENTNLKLKVQVAGPTTTYTYNIQKDKWEVFPLSDGNGTYRVNVFRNLSGTRYTAVASGQFKAQMTDEFAPFIRSNQYVDFDNAPKTQVVAAQVCRGVNAPLDKVKAVYGYVVNGLTYDYNLAKTVTSGYLPSLDKVLASKRGICFDYAALMTGMLRSQGVPCKLVVGYTGNAYHAWISVYTPESGWINGAIFFDGKQWERMDPTFASTGKQTDNIHKYINNDANYSAKYFY